ncbi:hypothetical protein FA95DRAFT_563388 [Auriscalpium vulgare]|uniref:Uncharacterized protein n=1 Tax=Auriscalpium vulgare TaxID=40419 RepID=A0ACB8RE46_9AGAM|nr:hypothetical protein FA95DRAFT_563388 [Auriscalpium vulgare]
MDAAGTARSSASTFWEDTAKCRLAIFEGVPSVDPTHDLQSVIHSIKTRLPFHPPLLPWELKVEMQRMWIDVECKYQKSVEDVLEVQDQDDDFNGVILKITCNPTSLPANFRPSLSEAAFSWTRDAMEALAPVTSLAYTLTRLTRPASKPKPKPQLDG